MNACPLLVAGAAALVMAGQAAAQEAEELRPDEMAELSVLGFEADPQYPRPGEAVQLRCRSLGQQESVAPSG